MTGYEINKLLNVAFDINESEPLDPFNDLNDIHDLEMLWRSGNRLESELINHINILDEICRCHHNQVGDAAFANAPQRSEALLKALFLWK